MKRKFYPFRNLILGTMIGCLSSVWVFAGGGSLELLPSEDKIAPWMKKEGPRTFDGGHLFEYIDGGADIFLEYGFVEVVSQEYVKGEISIVVEIYRMESPDAAFGVHSFNRDHRAPPAEVGTDGMYSDYRLAFYQADYYVVIQTFSLEEESKRELSAFATNIAANIPRKGEIPVLTKYLPQSHLVARSEKLVMGSLGFNNLHYLTDDEDLFGFKRGNKGVFAKYELQGNELQFFLLACKTPVEAQEVLSGLRRFYEKKGEVAPLRAVTGSAGFSQKDDRGRYQVVRANDRFLAAVFDAPHVEDALVILEDSVAGQGLVGAVIGPIGLPD